MRAKILSSGLEAKTCYRGERIPAIGDGWSRNFFIALRLLSSSQAFSSGVSPSTLLRDPLCHLRRSLLACDAAQHSAHSENVSCHFTKTKLLNRFSTNRRYANRII
jgi:hypothetical protein